jgi:hypothetical protein
MIIKLLQIVKNNTIYLAILVSEFSDIIASIACLGLVVFSSLIPNDETAIVLGVIMFILCLP